MKIEPRQPIEGGSAPNSNARPKVAVRASELTRQFKSVLAVDRVTLEVFEGSIFGILGPNGAGKTTTIRLLLGLIQPTSGAAVVLGVDPAKSGDSVRAVSGALLEHSGVYERLSVEENLEFYARLAGLPLLERRPRIEFLLRHFELWERRKDRAGLLSRGMKQKLGIARAMLHGPRLVFLDEPTAGLDPEATAALREDIVRMARDSGATVFLTTHNLAEAERVCDSVAIIRKGRLLANGPIGVLKQDYPYRVFEIRGFGIESRTADELGHHPGVCAATIERDQLIVSIRKGATISGIVAALANAGIRVTETHEVPPRLEDVYLAVMRSAERNAT
jgi:ABC-2 type transport system ATP-binding protein